MPAKQCNSCFITKGSDKFYPSSKNKDGLQGECKLCAKARKKEYRRKEREWLDDFKKTLSCEECGERHPATLDFHHIDSNTKEMNIARAFATGLSRKRILKEMEKCIVLCSNCHRKLHWEERRNMW